MKPLTTILFVVFMISCNDFSSPLERINEKLSIGNYLELHKDIPHYINDSNLYWEWVRKERRKTGLPSVENGSEYLQLRIWQELDWGRMCVIFSHKNHSWFADRYVFKGYSRDSANVDSIGVIYNSLGIPKSGWNKFLNRMIDYRILDLNDASEIPGYFEATDQQCIGVEISAKNYYRYYQLFGVYDQPKNIVDARSMAKIQELIKNEFPGVDKE